MSRTAAKTSVALTGLGGLGAFLWNLVQHAQTAEGLFQDRAMMGRFLFSQWGALAAVVVSVAAYVWVDRKERASRTRTISLAQRKTMKEELAQRPPEDNRVEFWRSIDASDWGQLRKTIAPLFEAAGWKVDPKTYPTNQPEHKRGVWIRGANRQVRVIAREVIQAGGLEVRIDDTGPQSIPLQIIFGMAPWLVVEGDDEHVAALPPPEQTAPVVAEVANLRERVPPQPFKAPPKPPTPIKQSVDPLLEIANLRLRLDTLKLHGAPPHEIEKAVDSYKAAIAALPELSPEVLDLEWLPPTNLHLDAKVVTREPDGVKGVRVILLRLKRKVDGQFSAQGDFHDMPETEMHGARLVVRDEVGEPVRFLRRLGSESLRFNGRSPDTERTIRAHGEWKAWFRLEAGGRRREVVLCFHWNESGLKPCLCKEATGYEIALKRMEKENG